MEDERVGEHDLARLLRRRGQPVFAQRVLDDEHVHLREQLQVIRDRHRMIDRQIHCKAGPRHLAAIAPDDAADDFRQKAFLLATLEHVPTDPVCVDGKRRRENAPMSFQVVDRAEVSPVHEVALERGDQDRRRVSPGVLRAAGGPEPDVLGERQRVEMEVDARLAAPTSGESRASFADDDRVGPGQNEDHVFEKAGIGEKLHAPIPVPDVRDLVHEQVCRLAGRSVRGDPAKQRDQRMMVVDQLAGPGRASAAGKLPRPASRPSTV